MRKGMAYGRMRQIDKMTALEFRALPADEQQIYLRTERPLIERIEAVARAYDRLNEERT